MLWTAPSSAHRCHRCGRCRRQSKRRAGSGNGRVCLLAFGAQLRRIKEQILEFDRLIRPWHRSNAMSMRLDEAPGVGPVLATAVVATVADPKSFPNSTQVGARSGSAVSANRVTAICAACSWPVHSLSSAMPRSTAPGIGPGSRRCWGGGRRRSPR
jgi:transposase